MKFKNKSQKQLVTVLALSAVLFTSCDPLGLQPVDKVAEEKFWENPQLARSYVNRLYLWKPVTANQYFQSEQWSDNAIGNDDPDNNVFRPRKISQREYDALTSPGIAPWDAQYKMIRSVNIGLDRIMETPGLDEAKGKQMLAECYVFRALLYLEMEQYWGPVPLVDKVLTITDNTMIPRSSREELFEFMLADLDRAIALFKESGLKPAKGLANESAAELAKSRIALYAACAADASAKGLYDKLSGDESVKSLFRFTNTSNHYYEIALKAAGNVIGKYSLDPSYENLFNSENGYKSPEAIWPVGYKDQQRVDFNPAKENGPNGNYYEFQGSKSWGRRGSAFPTQDLVDCYYQKDEADGKWKQWWKTRQVLRGMNGSVDAQTGDFKGTGENYHVMYQNRDKRFYTTIIYDSCYYAGCIVRTWIDDTFNKEKFSARHTGFIYTTNLDAPTGRHASSGTITSYYPRKFMQGKTNEDGTLDVTQPTTCFFMFRYAEVLLNYAEAAIKLNKEKEALPKINEIRNRAGLDNFDASVVGHNLWEEYKLQRRVEFAYEVPGHRYYDLLRWSEAEGKSVIEELNRGPKAMMIFRKGVEIDKVAEIGYPVAAGEPGYFVPRIETRRFTYELHNRVFDEAKYYFFPFSQSLIESYNGFVQNPGW